MNLAQHRWKVVMWLLQAGRQAKKWNWRATFSRTSVVIINHVRNKLESKNNKNITVMLLLKRALVCFIFLFQKKRRNIKYFTPNEKLIFMCLINLNCCIYNVSWSWLVSHKQKNYGGLCKSSCRYDSPSPFDHIYGDTSDNIVLRKWTKLPQKNVSLQNVLVDSFFTNQRIKKNNLKTEEVLSEETCVLFKFLILPPKKRKISVELRHSILFNKLTTNNPQSKSGN